MRQDLHFWLTIMVRGFVALLAGSAILIVPDLARTILLLPVAVVVAITGLAAYGVVDSVLVFVSSFMVESTRARAALRVQGFVGVAVGLLLLSVVFDRVQLNWFLSLAAIQALCAAAAETVVARHASDRPVGRWNYTTAAIAFVFFTLYVYLRIHADDLTPRTLSWSVYAYLVAFGIAECITAARMLYANQHSIIRLPSGGTERGA